MVETSYLFCYRAESLHPFLCRDLIRIIETDNMSFLTSPMAKTPDPMKVWINHMDISPISSAVLGQWPLPCDCFVSFS